MKQVLSEGGLRQIHCTRVRSFLLSKRVQSNICTTQIFNLSQYITHSFGKTNLTHIPDYDQSQIKLTVTTLQLVHSQFVYNSRTKTPLECSKVKHLNLVTH